MHLAVAWVCRGYPWQPPSIGRGPFARQQTLLDQRLPLVTTRLAPVQPSGDTSWHDEEAVVRAPGVRPAVKRLLDILVMSAGGWLGWAAGAWISPFTAFVVSMVGTGVGLYVARRITKALLP